MKSNSLRLVTSIYFQVQLHSIADPIIFESQVILERSFTLPLNHDLVWLPSDACSD